MKISHNVLDKIALSHLFLSRLQCLEIDLPFPIGRRVVGDALRGNACGFQDLSSIVQNLSNERFCSVCRGTFLVLGFFRPVRLDDESLVSDTAPDLLSRMWRKWSQHSCSRFQDIS